MTFDYSLLTTFDTIYVLVSGGVDSTYLYEKTRKLYPAKTVPVNCYNPYETSNTLSQISKDPKFIQITPSEKYNYAEILKNAFLKLPEACKLKQHGNYHKKIFACCYYIKHKAFLNDQLFRENGVVVISGIKAGDGNQRNHWCRKLRKEGTFFHKHKGGQLYCYPFRDYMKREFPKKIINKLKLSYPELSHSGCSICPILVLFNIKSEKQRYRKSVRYAQQLGVYNNHSIVEYMEGS